MYGLGYPDVEAERAILRLARGEAMHASVERPENPLKQEEILLARQEVLSVHMEPLSRGIYRSADQCQP